MATPTRRFPSATLVAIFLALLAPAAAAQIRIAGAIAGTVADSSEALVPGAAVQLVDGLTGISRETVTNDSGGFVFPDLSFGSYRVTVTLQGFRTAVFEHVRVESSRTTDLRITLQVGALDEQVQVQGVTPVLEMTSNIVSTTVNNKALEELPVWTTSALNNTLPSVRFLIDDANITSQTFGQVSGPANASRSMQLRAGFSF
jgi:Carboxypeptidase regulatory-like domain